MIVGLIIAAVVLGICGAALGGALPSALNKCKCGKNFFRCKMMMIVVAPLQTTSTIEATTMLPTTITSATTITLTTETTTTTTTDK